MLNLFAEISVLADERVGTLSKEQRLRKIMEICAQAGIGVPACIGATGPAYPPERS